MPYVFPVFHDGVETQAVCSKVVVHNSVRNKPRWRANIQWSCHRLQSSPTIDRPLKLRPRQSTTSKSSRQAINVYRVSVRFHNRTIQAPADVTSRVLHGQVCHPRSNQMRMLGKRACYATHDEATNTCLVNGCINMRGGEGGVSQQNPYTVVRAKDIEQR
ncbi:hypothetical protein M440DRAFT_304413 [Trichoderma longibrachiatum ATCC 18648]|uniref:Uncharacterized protein n=1 Tax=Trichoderma longibrachiatum ATCC 18648 TaxID=983965 RepID=A0A2T4C5I5_TRILO|nr:hypothetical protein M440DRAFT_304413 [Trichoderma longibrachiatum ATCC 18648]